MGATNLKLYAAEYADGYVFAIDEKKCPVCHDRTTTSPM